MKNLTQKLTNKNFISHIKTGAEVLVILILLAVISYLSFELYYIDKVYPGVKIGEHKLEGKTLKQTKQYIQNKTKKIDQEGVKFKYKDKETTIMPTVSSFEPDLAYPVMTFNKQKTAHKAFEYGRTGNFWTDLSHKLQALRRGKNIDLEFNLESKKIRETLHKKYKDQEIPAKDAKLIVTNHEQATLSITPETLGKVINYKQGLQDLKTHLANLNLETIQLKDKTDYPEIYRSEVLDAKFQAKNILSLAPITLFYKDNEWEIDRTQLSEFIVLNHDSSSSKKITLSKDKVINFLEEKVGPEINKEPKKADFKIKNDKVKEFQIPENGRELKLEKTWKQFKTKLLSQEQTEIELAVKTIHYQQNKKKLGIEEVIGTGYSSFQGSPANRVHNIQVGANTLNGMLIKPGEEFSLVGALGKINKNTGYKPELVIKGDETKPEYGGGLCQIATTVFRAAVDSGLKITERRNHSYRVPYYEPAGTDATIYNPKPDLKFKNNTPGHIMIQSRIENGHELYFDFWSTDDGRVASSSDPVIYNITEPGPTKYVKTDELEPGEEKCTESAHKGADAYFDYEVFYPPEESTSTEKETIIDRRFRSHYVPWREVCLVGKEKSTSTPETKEEDADN